MAGESVRGAVPATEAFTEADSATGTATGMSTSSPGLPDLGFDLFLSVLDLDLDFLPFLSLGWFPSD